MSQLISVNISDNCGELIFYFFSPLSLTSKHRIYLSELQLVQCSSGCSTVYGAGSHVHTAVEPTCVCDCCCVTAVVSCSGSKGSNLYSFVELIMFIMSHFPWHWGTDVPYSFISNYAKFWSLLTHGWTNNRVFSVLCTLKSFISWTKKKELHRLLPFKIRNLIHTRIFKPYVVLTHLDAR